MVLAGALGGLPATGTVGDGAMTCGAGMLMGTTGTTGTTGTGTVPAGTIVGVVLGLIGTGTATVGVGAVMLGATGTTVGARVGARVGMTVGCFAVGVAGTTVGMGRGVS